MDAAALDDYKGILDRNEIWLERTRGSASSRRPTRSRSARPARTCAPRASTGISAATSRTCTTTRSTSSVPVYPNGDVYDRYRVRMDEMAESTNIVRQCLDKLERMEGMPWIADDRKVVLPPREELHTSMESLIHHFKIVTEGFRVPEGEIYVAVESPRGESGCYLVSDGGPKPWRIHFRAPSFVALEATATCLDDTLVADLIAVVGSLDAVMGTPTGEHVLRRGAGDPGAVSRRARARPRCRRCGSRRRSTAGFLARRSRRPPRRSRSTPAFCYSVATFYDMLHLEPVGKHTIDVCTNLPCALCGAQRVIEAFESELGIQRRRDDRGRRGHAPRGRVPRRLRLRDRRRRRRPLPPQRHGPRRCRRSWRARG